LFALFPRALIPHGLETRAWAFSSHGEQSAEPLTPLSRSIVHPQRFTELPRCCLFLCLGHTSAFLRVGVDRGMRKPPRPSPSPARESLRRVLARDAFCHWGPFTGSGGRYSPGPTTDTPLLAMGRPLDDTLVPPWVFVRTSPHSGARPDCPRRTFRPPYPTMVSSTAVHFELDPRSLDPAALFGARLPSLFEVRRRLMTSATALLRRAGNQTWALFSSQGRWPRPSSFSYAPRRSFEQ